MMFTCQRLCAGLLVLAVCAPSIAEEFSRIQDEMSAQDFEKSGLKRLSNEELEHLNSWLKRNLELADLPPETPAASIVAPPPQPQEPAPQAPAAAPPAAGATPPEAGATTPTVSEAGFEKQRVRSRQKFTSRLVGNFSGWSGKTTFKLENGQVWRQARSGSYRHRTLTNPTVTLVPKALNTWSLEIEGLNRSVRVKRIK